MLAYLLRRVGYLMFVVWGVGFAAFFISRVVPADPAAAALGPNAREEQIEAYREQFGLNDPVPVQYVNYMRDLFRGDLGESLRNKIPVTELLASKLPVTVELAVCSMLVAVLIGLPTGVLSAVRRGTAIDVAANAVLTRKEQRGLQRKKRAEAVAARRAELSRERTLRRMDGRKGGRR